jgi:hypothetical protein
VYSLCFAFLFTACQKEPLEYPEEVVVEGWIEAGGHPVVMLSRTFVVTSGEETEEEQSIVLPWGKVVVSDGEKTVVLTGDYDERYFPPYIYSSSRMRGVPGRTYYLTIEYGERILTAQTTIPMIASLETLEVSPCEYNDSIYQITASFYDNPQTEDYYLFLTRIFNRETRFYPAFLGVMDDVNLVEYNRHVVYPGVHTLTSEKHDYHSHFLASDSVQIKFARIDEATYNIYKAYNEVVALANNPLFASDISMPTNIQGGIGFWCGFGMTKYNIVIADSIRNGEP